MKGSLFLVLTLSIVLVNCDKAAKKYSKDANEPKTAKPELRNPVDPSEANFRTLVKPFRMAKLNLVWTKAQHRLSEPKLRSLFTELKIQDKEELAWKQLNAQHHDKEGIKADDLRKKLIGIMSTYDLLEHFDETQNRDEVKKYKGAIDADDHEKYKNKSLFKDKKLNKLWDKAEVSGFTPEELQALKEEFEHHQEKIDLYYELLDNLDNIQVEGADPSNSVNSDEHDKFNEINLNEETNEIEKVPNKHQDHLTKINMLRDKHRELKDGFDRLERVAAQGPKSEDFVEPKVQGLWRVALASNFTADELGSLKVELLHYESRLLKLRHMHAEHALAAEKVKHHKDHDKVGRMNQLEETIQKQTRKVEKLGSEVEKRIFGHNEL